MLILQDMKKFGLQQRRHFADFVEQDRSLVAQLKLAGLGMSRAGEGSWLVAEQFALQQVAGNRGAIHLQEGAVRPG